MSVNYATKYASVVDERFKLGSLTAGLVNQNFDWLGVKTVKVFSRDLATLNNYSTTGTNRYGTPSELGNDEQEMTISQDKAFTYTIDAASEQDTNGTMEAAATLRENIDNLIIPALDTYRIATLVSKVPTTHLVKADVTKTTAYEAFLAVQEKLDDDKAPVAGRVCIATPKYINLIKQDDNFTKVGDLATKMALNGQIGEIDGVPVIKAPTSYFPTGIDFVITNPAVAPSPVKLQEFKINYNAPGISGALVEARVRFDCFALNKKVNAIGVHAKANYTPASTSTTPATDGE